ncbi:MAG TPA: hypothetical protein PK587_02945 [Syntrophales bacterium]|nr:hypothetical protein [Syntrophales bacterium]
MNKILLRIVLTPIVVIFLCLFAPHVEAGLIHHHVTVKNETQNSAQITVRTFDGHKLQATVAAGGKHQFDTGVKCPRAVYGEMDWYAHGRKIQIEGACTGGSGQPYSDVNDCGLNCASSSFRLICQPRDNYNGVACYFVKE